MPYFTHSRISLLPDTLNKSGLYESNLWIITPNHVGCRCHGKSSDPFSDYAPLPAGKGHFEERDFHPPIVNASG
ncbi:MAG: hypothetical protein K7J46_11460 [Bryobacter sp.]|nr:hypothetical protein [Bryobacter sp. CoA8 C33]